MRQRRFDLVWDEWNREHIKKHNLTVEEVKEGYKNEFLRTKTINKKILLFGRNRSGRVLTIVLS